MFGRNSGSSLILRPIPLAELDYEKELTRVIGAAGYFSRQLER